MDQVARLCSHAVIIRQGKLITQGAISDLLANNGESDLEQLFIKLTQEPELA